MVAQNTMVRKQPPTKKQPQGKAFSRIPQPNLVDFGNASLFAKTESIIKELTATYGSKLNHRLEALRLLSEIEHLLNGEKNEKQSRALELICGIRERLNAQYGSKPHHSLEAQKMISALGAILPGNG